MSWAGREEKRAWISFGFCGGPVSSASAADGIGQLCGQPLGDFECVLGAGGVGGFPLSARPNGFIGAAPSRAGVVRRGRCHERTHRRAAGIVTSHGLLVEPWIFACWHSPQLAIVCSDFDRQRGRRGIRAPRTQHRHHRRIQRQGLHLVPILLHPVPRLWEYIGMFLLPIGQNVDPDVAVSHTVLDHGAIVGLIALLAVSVRGLDLSAPFSACILWLVCFSFVDRADLVVRADRGCVRRAPIVSALHRTAVDRCGFSGAMENYASTTHDCGAEHRASRGGCSHVSEKPIMGQRHRSVEGQRRQSRRTNTGRASSSRSHISRPATTATPSSSFRRSRNFDHPTFDLLVDWGLAYNCGRKAGPSAGQDEAGRRDRAQRARVFADRHDLRQDGQVSGSAGCARRRPQQLNPRFAMTYYYAR